MKDDLQFPVRLLDNRITEAVTPYAPARAFSVFFLGSNPHLQVFLFFLVVLVLCSTSTTTAWVEGMVMYLHKVFPASVAAQEWYRTLRTTVVPSCWWKSQYHQTLAALEFLRFIQKRVDLTKCFWAQVHVVHFNVFLIVFVLEMVNAFSTVPRKRTPSSSSLVVLHTVTRSLPCLAALKVSRHRADQAKRWSMKAEENAFDFDADICKRTSLVASRRFFLELKHATVNNTLLVRVPRNHWKLPRQRTGHWVQTFGRLLVCVLRLLWGVAFGDTARSSASRCGSTA